MYYFYHVSTDEVDGALESNTPTFTEQRQSSSAYAASKVGSCYHTYGLNTAIINFSNNYGLYHFPEKIIPLTIVNCLEGKPLPICDDGKKFVIGFMSKTITRHRPYNSKRKRGGVL